MDQNVSIEKADRNDRNVQMFLNGQYKKLRDAMAGSSRVSKKEVYSTDMNDSVMNNYNNRPVKLLTKKNLPNKRRLSHITDQE